MAVPPFLDEVGGEVLEAVVVPGERGALEPRLPEPQVGGRVLVADGAVVVAVGDAAPHVGHVGRPERVGGVARRTLPLTRGLEEPGWPGCQLAMFLVVGPTNKS